LPPVEHKELSEKGVGGGPKMGTIQAVNLNEGMRKKRVKSEWKGRKETCFLQKTQWGKAVARI